MITFFILILIYIAFISLGLPDSLLGASWPAMRQTFGMPLDAAGFVSTTIAVCTITSSLLSGHIIKRFGTGKVTVISCFLTGFALIGVSMAPSYAWLFLFALPLGFGAGSVDTALNNYVALHFKAHHMNWLHSFWGVGATAGPILLAISIKNNGSWRSGYTTIAIIQIILAFILLISLPLWKKHEAIANTHQEEETMSLNTGKKPFQIKGVKHAIATFVFYCTVEFSVGLWGSSFLVSSKNLSVESAAFYISLYYGGITIGRFLTGFISFKLNNTQLIRIGSLIGGVSVIVLALPIPTNLIIIPLMFLGIGLAPIFPAMIHETPRRFGKAQSQVIIGYQMGFGYMGTTILTPLIGVLLRNTSTDLFPFCLIIGTLALIYTTEHLRKKVALT